MNKWFNNIKLLDCFSNSYLTCANYKILSGAIQRKDVDSATRILIKLKGEIHKLLLANVKLPADKVELLESLVLEGARYVRNKEI